ncbi:MAG: Omp28-related outer membrane protein [Flavobacteriales bacterium]|nr:Omp28-related outer membrane protein [Flavobacteriales bacterium]
MPSPYMLLVAFILCSTALSAQDLAGAAPRDRTALLEEFTAAGCGNCPVAHATADALVTVHGARLVVVGVHGGALAAPNSGQPDFRTTDGAALWQSFDIQFQPQGTVNRQLPQTAEQWAGQVQEVLDDPSPVNLGVASVFDVNTRQLTVQVELYYTGSSATPMDRISVMLTQGSVVAFQQDYANGPHSAYHHRHVLRDHVTPLEGDMVDVTSPGTLVQRTYSTAVPEAWDAVDLRVVAFVRAQDGEVYQAYDIPAVGGISSGMDQGHAPLLGSAFPVPAHEVLFIPVTAAGAGRSVRLCDAQGRLVLEQRAPPNGGTLALDVSSLAPGVYAFGCAGAQMQSVIVR